jgi:hypothetical protein
VLLIGCFVKDFNVILINCICLIINYIDLHGVNIILLAFCLTVAFLMFIHGRYEFMWSIIVLHYFAAK